MNTMIKISTPEHELACHYGAGKLVRSSGLAVSYIPELNAIHLQGLKSNDEPVTKLGLAFCNEYLSELISKLIVKLELRDLNCGVNFSSYLQLLLICL